MTRDSSRRPLLMAGLVILVIGAAHLGLFLLLTAGARSSIEEIEARYGKEALDEAVEPGARPGSSAEVSTWNRVQSLWEAKGRRAHSLKFVNLMRLALLGSFLVQAVGLCVLLARRT